MTFLEVEFPMLREQQKKEKRKSREGWRKSEIEQKRDLGEIEFRNKSFETSSTIAGREKSKTAMNFYVNILVNVSFHVIMCGAYYSNKGEKKARTKL